MRNITNEIVHSRGIAGQISADTLERWALVRQIAELEEVLADNYTCRADDSGHAWMEQTRLLIAEKRSTLARIAARNLSKADTVAW
jgi:hypothetical protein